MRLAELCGKGWSALQNAIIGNAVDSGIFHGHQLG